jgi:hypothetical protein
MNDDILYNIMLNASLKTLLNFKLTCHKAHYFFTLIYFWENKLKHDQLQLYNQIYNPCNVAVPSIHINVSYKKYIQCYHYLFQCRKNIKYYLTQNIIINLLNVKYCHLTLKKQLFSLFCLETQYKSEYKIICQKLNASTYDIMITDNHNNIILHKNCHFNLIKTCLFITLQYSSQYLLNVEDFYYI